VPQTGGHRRRTNAAALWGCENSLEKKKKQEKKKKVMRTLLGPFSTTIDMHKAKSNPSKTLVGASWARTG